MSSFTAPRRTYSALSYSSSSSDEAHTGKPQEIVARSNKSTPRTIPRHSFLVRVAVFVLLEFGFIALVTAASYRPIILNLSFTNTQTKSIVTAIAILWHALAVVIVKEILLNVFSAEWVEQHNGSHSLTLQELDVVSRLPTGFIDQARHCVSRRATYSFRLCFISSLLLILLNGLGPSAITVDYTPFNYPHTIQVANLTIGSPAAEDTTFEGMSAMPPRVDALTQLEVVQNTTTFGFTSREPNVLVPWPSSDSLSDNMTIKYPSDVIRSNFSCSWNKPALVDSSLNRWKVGDIDRWDVCPSWTCTNTDLPFSGPGIYRLFKNKTNPFSAFLFAQTSAHPTSDFSLEDIPSLLLPCNVLRNPSIGDSRERGCSSLWSFSILICNPQLEVLPALINATMSSLEATILPGAPTVKNIPITAAEFIFSQSLSDPKITTLDTIPYLLFLPQGNSTEKGPIKPLPLLEINRNMTNLLTSTAKAYLNGYQPKDFHGLSHSFVTVNTSRTIEVQTMALVGSKPFFLALTVTVGLLVLLLVALVIMTQPDQLEGFDLENIVKRLHASYFSDSII